MEWFKNLGFGTVMFVSWLSVLSHLLASWGAEPWVFGISATLVAIAFAFALGVVVLFVWFKVVKKIFPRLQGTHLRGHVRHAAARQVARHQFDLDDIDPAVLDYLDPPRLDAADLEMFRVIEHTLDDASPLFEIILQYIPLREMHRLRAVCKRFQQVVDDLEYLDMYGSALSADVKRYVACSHRLLKELSLAVCDHNNVYVMNAESIDDDQLSMIADNLPLLEALSLRGNDLITDAGLAHLQRLEHLESLDISNCDKLTNDGIQVLSKCPELIEVAASSCPLITTEGLIRLARSCKYPEEFTYSVGAEGPAKTFKEDAELIPATPAPTIDLYLDRLPEDDPMHATPILAYPVPEDIEDGYNSEDDDDSEDYSEEEVVPMPIPTIFDRLAAYDLREEEEKKRQAALALIRAVAEKADDDDDKPPSMIQ